MNLNEYAVETREMLARTKAYCSWLGAKDSEFLDLVSEWLERPLPPSEFSWRWTDEPPKVPGWYWERMPGGKVRCSQVPEHDIHLNEPMDGWAWSDRPIPEPSGEPMEETLSQRISRESLERHGREMSAERAQENELTWAQGHNAGIHAAWQAVADILDGKIPEGNRGETCERLIQLLQPASPWRDSPPDVPGTWEMIKTDVITAEDFNGGIYFSPDAKWRLVAPLPAAALKGEQRG